MIFEHGHARRWDLLRRFVMLRAGDELADDAAFSLADVYFDLKDDAAVARVAGAGEDAPNARYITAQIFHAEEKSSRPQLNLANGVGATEAAEAHGNHPKTGSRNLMPHAKTQRRKGFR